MDRNQENSQRGDGADFKNKTKGVTEAMTEEGIRVEF